MSRIGRLPITVPANVNVEIGSENISVKGPKGELSEPLLSGILVEQKDNEILVSREDDHRINRSNHGLMRTLIDNMIKGVTDGFDVELQVTGVGYRVALAGSELKLKLGFSHEVIYKIPEGIKIETDQNKIKVSGIKKQFVGQVAAEIRANKKPEPYKGKGISYVGERILRKSGKSGKD